MCVSVAVAMIFLALNDLYLVRMRMMRCVGADRLEYMFEVVRDEIESHEEQKH